jgi:hypothetical protein
MLTRPLFLSLSTTAAKEAGFLFVLELVLRKAV